MKNFYLRLKTKHTLSVQNRFTKTYNYKMVQANHRYTISVKLPTKLVSRIIRIRQLLEYLNKWKIKKSVHTAINAIEYPKKIVTLSQ